jgi:lysophospholipid acyltransferase (LPLAT)-like uncharacterized protein
VPVNYTCRRGINLPWRWDKAYLPTPFDRIVVHYGSPILADGRAAEELIEAVQSAVTSHDTGGLQ